MAPRQLRQPLSFNELNTALAGAHKEVKSLRQQYDELQALVSERLGSEARGQTKPSPSAADTDKVTPDGRVETRETGSQARPSAVVPPAPLRLDVPAEIADLSGDEAKKALSVSGVCACASAAKRCRMPSPLCVH